MKKLQKSNENQINISKNEMYGFKGSVTERRVCCRDGHEKETSLRGKKYGLRCRLEKSTHATQIAYKHVFSGFICSFTGARCKFFTFSQQMSRVIQKMKTIC